MGAQEDLLLYILCSKPLPSLANKAKMLLKILQFSRSKESMLSNSRDINFHLSNVYRERRRKSERSQTHITTLQHPIATLFKQHCLAERSAPEPNANAYSLWDPGRVT